MEDLRLDQPDTTVFNAPSNRNTNIWRYMDFTKFISLLNSGSLHLTRCDQFDDTIDEFVPPNEVNTDLERETLADRQSLSKTQTSTTSDTFRKLQKRYVFINCWHIHEGESIALWRRYTRTNEAIAIQTRFSKLREALPANYYIGQVNYVDSQAYKRCRNERLYPIMHKRKSFEHERELRVCYVDTYEFSQHMKNPEDYHLSDKTRLVETIPVDVQSLVETVRVAPGAPSWLVELVKDSLILFGYRLPVSQANTTDSLYP